MQQVRVQRRRSRPRADESPANGQVTAENGTRGTRGTGTVLRAIEAALAEH